MIFLSSKYLKYIKKKTISHIYKYFIRIIQILLNQPVCLKTHHIIKHLLGALVDIFALFWTY